MNNSTEECEHIVTVTFAPVSFRMYSNSTTTQDALLKQAQKLADNLAKCCSCEGMSLTVENISIA